MKKKTEKTELIFNKACVGSLSKQLHLEIGYIKTTDTRKIYMGFPDIILPIADAE